MKLLLTGDWHLTDIKPKRRLDDYFATQIDKLEQVRRIYEEYKCVAVIQPGDFFDKYRTSHRVVSEVLRYLLTCWRGVPLFCIFGQHDIDGHSAATIHNSALKVLHAAEVVNLISNYGAREVIDGVELVGLGFGEELSGNESDDWMDDDFKVLVVHKMICGESLYPGHKPTTPKAFLRQNPDYDLIVCGDYHYRFIENIRDRYIINPGCLVRKTIGEKDLAHEPAVVIFDTETREAVVEKLAVQPVEKVFNFTVSERLDEPDYEALNKFLENMEAAEGVDIGWREILLGLYKKEGINKRVCDLVDFAIVEANK